jgi:HlyD family secretion protein
MGQDLGAPTSRSIITPAKTFGRQNDLTKAYAGPAASAGALRLPLPHATRDSHGFLTCRVCPSASFDLNHCKRLNKGASALAEPQVTPMLDLPKPVLRALPPKVREPQRRTNSAPVKEETGNRRRLYWLAALLLLVAVIGAGTWRFFLRPLTVQIAPVAINVPEQVFGLGMVGADVQSTVGFKVAGVINEIDANEGDHVKTGQVLARLDARDVEAQVAQARAAVPQAQAAIDKGKADVALAEANQANAVAMAERRRVLVKQGFASREETQTLETTEKVSAANVKVANVEAETARAGLAVAQAQLDFAEATLANYTLRAPYNGWVLARTRNLGDAVVAGQAVFTLAEPSTIWVVGYVDERLAGRLKVGQPAEIELRSEPGRRFPGHVARIEIQSDAVNEERLVDVAFDHLPPDIHLAEQAEVYITTGKLRHAMVIPQTRVLNTTGDPGTGERGTVWTLEHGQLAQRQVTFGPELLNGGMPVLSGLPADARVVVSPPDGFRVGRAATIERKAKP